jgi:hypothetical protein
MSRTDDIIDVASYRLSLTRTIAGPSWFVTPNHSRDGPDR